ncbi:hypothetical protein E5350_08480 [Lactobacillus johnsonii]|uniref:hypothetical protein n=1 Tax=Lactobacillus johnsonii TaxID=33959 RepID=UPI0010935966|nr:hypothetical protein [Lactobacillus johnsonii]TGY25855.1 hypothetical protein E5350_08480 [Lactobacillus johnsonii]
MDILIRNVDPFTVLAIDRMVKNFNKKNHSKISRSEFLRREIEKIPERNIYKKVNSDVAVQLEIMNSRIKTQSDAYNKIFFLLVTGDTEGALNLSEELSKNENINNK